MKPKRTVLIMGDQLHRENSALEGASPQDTQLLFITSRGQVAGKRWHRQRLHLVLAGMARLAEEFRREGFEVDERIADSFGDALREHRERYKPSEIAAMSPMSWSGVQNLERHKVTLTPNIAVSL